MGWKQPERNTIKLGECEVGREILGKYTGSKLVDAGGREALIWSYTDEQDKPFGIWGCAALNGEMEPVKVGSYCKITYLGKGEIKKKGNFPLKVKVEVWVDDEKEAK